MVLNSNLDEDPEDYNFLPDDNTDERAEMNIPPELRALMARSMKTAVSHLSG